MNRLRTPTLAAGLLAASLLAGCSDLPFGRDWMHGGDHPRAEQVASRGSRALREGIALYNDGDYNAAIRRLSSDDLDGAPVATRVKALKYTAFSYCVTSRTSQCRQAFEKALRLDPKFDLAPGEHGHPLWGPVFAQAKKDR